MDTLNISSVDLVSTLRTAPKNGAPSSQDYNDSLREILVDLGALSETLNGSILPILNALPEEAANGLEGRTIYASLDADKNPLFYSSSDQKFLTVADVLQNLYTMLAQSNNTLTDVTARIITLQSKLATTSHNDVINAVQGFTSQIRQVSYGQTSLTRAVEAQAEQLAKVRGTRKDITLASEATDTVDINWAPAYEDNNYTVSLSVEGGQAGVSFIKKANGAGVTIKVISGESEETMFTIHASAKAD